MGDNVKKSPESVKSKLEKSQKTVGGRSARERVKAPGVDFTLAKR